MGGGRKTAEGLTRFLVRGFAGLDSRLAFASLAFAGLVPTTAQAALSPLEGIGFGAGGTALLFAALILLLVTLERRRREAALREAGRESVRRGRLAATLATAPGGYYRWTADDHQEAFSEGLAELLGEKPRELSSFGQFAHAFGSADFERLERAVEALRNGGTPFGLTLPTASEGRLLEIAGSPLPGSGPAGLVVWFRDMTAQAHELATLAKRLDEKTLDAARWRRLLDAVDFPVWLRDAAGALAWCNGAYARWLESMPEAVVKQGLELASALAADQAKELAEKARAVGRAVHERRHLVVRGERRLLEAVERPLADGTLGYARDITDIEVAEDELERHIAAHKEVLENLGTGIEIYGADRRLIYFNNAFVKMFRLDEEWLRTGPAIGEVIDAMRDRRRLPEQADFRAFKERQMELFTSLTEPVEEMLYLPDGTAIRQIVTPHPFGGLLYVSEDVSGRLALERSYHTLSEVQRATLDHLYEGVAVFGGDGRLKLFNPVYARMWRLSEEFLAGEPHVAEIVERTKALYDHESDWEDFKAELIARATQYERRDERLERRDGKILDCASMPLPDGAILKTYLDVTDTSNVERALRERNEALETADRLKSEFVANVSYELRTPLNTIIGFSEILDNRYFGDLNERQAEYVKGVLDSSQHLLDLINSILDLASIEAGHITLEIKAFEIVPMLKSIVALVDDRARKQNLELDCDCLEDLGVMEADERRIKQVLFNLLTNAIKFTPPGGRVAVGVRREGPEIALWVEDTGVGIGEDEKSRVFERFYRGKETGRHQPGTGLGLALVKSFVELHGGRVSLDSVPSSGTRVTCRFPAKVPARRTALAL